MPEKELFNKRPTERKPAAPGRARQCRAVQLLEIFLTTSLILVPQPWRIGSAVPDGTCRREELYQGTRVSDPPNLRKSGPVDILISRHASHILSPRRRN